MLDTNEPQLGALHLGATIEAPDPNEPQLGALRLGAVTGKHDTNEPSLGALPLGATLEAPDTNEPQLGVLRLVATAETHDTNEPSLGALRLWSLLALLAGSDGSAYEITSGVITCSCILPSSCSVAGHCWPLARALMEALYISRRVRYSAHAFRQAAAEPLFTVAPSRRR